MAHNHQHTHQPHGHDHDHGHVHAMPESGVAFAVGSGVNGGFVVLQVVFGLLAGSVALLADALHNLGDVLGLLLAWGAAGMGRWRPPGRHTYGFGRSSILAALVNAAVLLVGAAAHQRLNGAALLLYRHDSSSTTNSRRISR